MQVKVTMFKDGACLRPYDDDAEELLARMSTTEIVEVDIRQLRNPMHHRLFWDMVNKAYPNTTDFPTRESFVQYLKLMAGHADLYTLTDGIVVRKPRSIAYDEMDETEFSLFHDRVRDYITNEMGIEL